MSILLSFRWEKLEGHETSKPGVFGFIHHPISSSTKLLDNTVSRCRLVVGWCARVVHSRRILGVSIYASQLRRFSTCLLVIIRATSFLFHSNYTVSSGGLMMVGFAVSLPLWDNCQMKITSLCRPNEQRKVENLLAKLAKLKPVCAKPTPILSEKNALRSA